MRTIDEPAGERGRTLVIRSAPDRTTARTGDDAVVNALLETSEEYQSARSVLASSFAQMVSIVGVSLLQIALGMSSAFLLKAALFGTVFVSAIQLLAANRARRRYAGARSKWMARFSKKEAG